MVATEGNYDTKIVGTVWSGQVVEDEGNNSRLVPEMYDSRAQSSRGVCFIGQGADWHVSFITLQVETAAGKLLGPCRHFPVNRWIRGPPGFPENPAVLQEGKHTSGDAPWVMELVTSMLKGAGTDANIFFSVEYLAEVHFKRAPKPLGSSVKSASRTLQLHTVALLLSHSSAQALACAQKSACCWFGE
jgi:hypothetical protein